eukprot:TRINITY_DN12768_c0_g3_i1.p1 TRINITY_DN12768_c0_g3~~TRINITY_DN12768_c0_g3_i1.p1  ORF type:complete len:702 (+),score=85.37 TRINITY_DN12768_c0_g3_i1:90-2195(+)
MRRFFAAAFALNTSVAYAALSVPVRTTDGVVIDAPLLGRLVDRTCSSLDGAHCPQLSRHSFGDIDGTFTRLLLVSDARAGWIGEIADDRTEFFQFPRLAEDAHKTLKHAIAVEAHVSARVDFSSLPPWHAHVPERYSVGLFPSHSLTWAGQWRVVVAPRAGRETSTALTLHGLGVLRISRPVVVTTLLVNVANASAVVIGYLRGEAVWRRHVAAHDNHTWQNCAATLYVVDEVVFLPLGSLTLGELTVSTSSSCIGKGKQGAMCDGDNSVPITLFSENRKNVAKIEGANVDVRAQRVHVSRWSPELVTLQDAWLFEQGRKWIQNGVTDYGVPSLEQIQGLFALLETMPLPAGVSWTHVNEEAEVLSVAIADFMSADSRPMNVRKGWEHTWNSNHFITLELCYLYWAEMSHDEHGDAGLVDIAASQNRSEDVDDVDVGSILSGVIQELTAENPRVANVLQSALSSLVPSDTAADSDVSLDPKEVQKQSFVIGSRVEALYEGKWYAGTLVKTPTYHKSAEKPWTVQCDDDPEGILTFTAAVRPVEPTDIESEQDIITAAQKNDALDASYALDEPIESKANVDGGIDRRIEEMNELSEYLKKTKDALEVTLQQRKMELESLLRELNEAKEQAASVADVSDIKGDAEPDRVAFRDVHEGTPFEPIATTAFINEDLTKVDNPIIDFVRTAVRRYKKNVRKLFWSHV